MPFEVNFFRSYTEINLKLGYKLIHHVFAVVSNSTNIYLMQNFGLIGE